MKLARAGHRHKVCGCGGARTRGGRVEHGVTPGGFYNFTSASAGVLDPEQGGPEEISLR